MFSMFPEMKVGTENVSREHKTVKQMSQPNPSQKCNCSFFFFKGKTGSIIKVSKHICKRMNELEGEKRLKE